MTDDLVNDLVYTSGHLGAEGLEAREGQVVVKVISFIWETIGILSGCHYLRKKCLNSQVKETTL